MNDPIFIINKDGTIIAANKMAREIFELENNVYSSVNHYIEYDPQKTNYITQIKDENYWVQVKVRPLNSELDIMNVQHLTISNYQKQISSEIDNKHRLNNAGIVMLHEEK